MTSFHCDYASPGSGSIGRRAAHDLAVTTTFEPGSGGGFSRCAFSNTSSACGGSGGGGGGGGALRVVSAASITLGPVATLRADGGATRIPEAASRAYVGWGSGGVVYLAAPSLEVARGALVSAISGAGGLGRIRVSVDPARCRMEGSFFPPMAPDCRPSAPDARCGTWVGRWPL